MYTLETKTEKNSFDEKGRICSFRVLQAPEQEMIQETEAPAFELQYLEGNDIYQMDAGDAEETWPLGLSGQDPFQMEIKCAWNFVLGNLNGGVLDDRGEFVSTDSRWPWGLWKERMGSQESIRELLKNTQTMRRGSGKPYLVYGRMERPAQIGDIPVLRWEFGNRIQEAPALFHSFWKSREGRYAAVLVNWTDESRTVTLYDRRLSEEKRTITVPARDCVLTEAEISGM